MYSLLAQAVVLALVLWFVGSPTHSSRWRLVVLAVYLTILLAPRILFKFALPSLLAQMALGVTLILVRRWEKGPESVF
jgi:hypothetical protein